MGYHTKHAETEKVTRNKLRVRAAGCQYIDKVLADAINVVAELWLKKKAE